MKQKSPGPYAYVLGRYLQGYPSRATAGFDLSPVAVVRPQAQKASGLNLAMDIELNRQLEDIGDDVRRLGETFAELNTTMNTWRLVHQVAKDFDGLRSDVFQQARQLVTHTSNLTKSLGNMALRSMNQTRNAISLNL